MEKVLITCYKDNIASAKSIQGSCGILENEVIDQENGKVIQRYWVDVAEALEKDKININLKNKFKIVDKAIFFNSCQQFFLVKIFLDNC